MEKHEISDEEKIKVTHQVDYFIDLLAKKYALEHEELVEAIRWVRQRKEFSDKVKTTSITSLLGVLVTAVLFTVWEGLKVLLGKNNS